MLLIFTNMNRWTAYAIPTKCEGEPNSAWIIFNLVFGREMEPYNREHKHLQSMVYRETVFEIRFPLIVELTGCVYFEES